MKKRRISTKALTLQAVLCAIILIFYAVPINFVGAQIVFLPLIAALVATLYLGSGFGLFCGVFMGLISFTAAWTMPASPFSLLFRYPWISVLPKALFPLAAFGAAKLFSKVVKNSVAVNTFSCLVGVAANTILTLGFILLFYNGRPLTLDDSSIVISPYLILPILAVNSTLEIVLTTLITPSVVFALQKAIPNPLEVAAPRRKKIPSPTVDSAPIDVENGVDEQKPTDE